MKPEIQDKIDNWLNGSYDNESKNTIRAMSFEEQADSFYKNLEFGTGGLFEFVSGDKNLCRE